MGQGPSYRNESNTAHAEQRRSPVAEEEQRRADAERAAEEQRKQAARDIFRLPLKEAKTIIKNKFRALALKLHPDRGGNATEFRLMNEAYECLMLRCTA